MWRFSLAWILALLTAPWVLGQEEIPPEWKVHWYIMTGPGEYGALGLSPGCFTFFYKWGTGPLFKGYRNYIGFKAFCDIYVPVDMSLTHI